MGINYAKEQSANKGDPLHVVQRLYKQLDGLLNDMEGAERNDLMTMPQRISGMIALARIMKMMQDIRRGDLDARAGTAVNKYAAAFASPDAVGGRGANTRPSPAIEFDPEPDEDDLRDGYAS